MTKVISSPDCGNSPKNRLLRDLTIAMAGGDRKAIADAVTADIEWLAIGRQPVHGLDDFCSLVSRFAPAMSLKIEHVVSHGRAGAVNGVIDFGKRKRAFCHMYEFSNLKGTRVRALTSYSIRID